MSLAPAVVEVVVEEVAESTAKLCSLITFLYNSKKKKDFVHQNLKKTHNKCINFTI